MRRLFVTSLLLLALVGLTALPLSAAGSRFTAEIEPFAFAVETLSVKRVSEGRFLVRFGVTGQLPVNCMGDPVCQAATPDLIPILGAFRVQFGDTKAVGTEGSVRGKMAAKLIRVDGTLLALARGVVSGSFTCTAGTCDTDMQMRAVTATRSGASGFLNLDLIGRFHILPDALSWDFLEGSGSLQVKPPSSKALRPSP